VIEQVDLFRGETAHIIGQDRLGQADQLIAVNAALVLQAFLDADQDLY